MRALLAPSLLVGLACSTGGPSGFTDTSATLSTTTQASFTSGPDSSTGETASTTAEPTTGLDPTTGTTAASEGGSSGASSSSSSTGEAPFCGDGVVQRGEVCDDGDDDEQDGCLSDCSAGQALLALVGVGDAPGLFARWIPGVGWSVSQAGVTLREAALAPLPTGGALAAVRRAGPVPQDDGELSYATWSPAQPDILANFADVGDFGFGLDGPALATAGVAATLSFLGTDNKHYSALFTDGAWAPFAPIPAGMVQIQAFGPSAATLAAGTAETYAVYAGDDGKVYLSLKSSPGGAWQASTQAPPPAVHKALTPAALVDDQGDLVIAYVRAADSKIGVVKLLTPQNAWTTEAVLDQAITDAEPALARTDAGALYLAWKGAGSQTIRAARGVAADDWGAPFTVEMPANTAAPALAPGLVGADVELLYPAGGQLRHARLVGEEVAEVGDVADAFGVVGRAAALRVQLAP